MAASYLSLDEVVTLCPDVLQEPQDINCAFVFDLPQHAVYYNVRACPAHTSAGRDGSTQPVPLTQGIPTNIQTNAHALRNSPASDSLLEMTQALHGENLNTSHHLDLRKNTECFFTVG